MLDPSPTRTARHGMVSTIDHVATAAGVDLLRRGGSAADAAVGANAVLAVVAPHMCGMGGDLWALVHDGKGAPEALDSSGRAGSGADAEGLRAEGHDRIPLRGHVAAVTIPGAVDGWVALHERHGRLPLGEVLAAAIRCAESGFTASPLLAAAAPAVADVPHNTDIPGDLAVGDVVRRPGSARSLQAVIESGRSGYYEGEFGSELIELGRGQYTEQDLATVQARWVEPLTVDAWGHRLWTVPPTSQGYLTLSGAWIADGLDLPTDPSDPDWVHLLVESASQAAFDRKAALYDGADGPALLDPTRLGPRRDAIDRSRAGNVVAPTGAGDTTYLCAVDGDGMGVSLINSNASGFGSHLVAGTTGIFLQDRGIGFNLDPGHPAELTPGHRPPHTLAPALVTRLDGSLRAVVGTMGGDGQPQIVLQLLARHLHGGADPGATVGAGRFVLNALDATSGFETWQPGTQRKVVVEGHAPAAWAAALEARGHAVEVVSDVPDMFGHSHLIEVTESGTLAGCADPRAVVGVAAGL